MDPIFGPREAKWAQNVNLAIDKIGLGGPSVHKMRRVDPIRTLKEPKWAKHTKICQFTKSAVEAQVPPYGPKINPKRT